MKVSMKCNEVNFHQNKMACILMKSDQLTGVELTEYICSHYINECTLNVHCFEYYFKSVITADCNITSKICKHVEGTLTKIKSTNVFMIVACST